MIADCSLDIVDRQPSGAVNQAVQARHYFKELLEEEGSIKKTGFKKWASSS